MVSDRDGTLNMVEVLLLSVWQQCQLCRRVGNGAKTHPSIAILDHGKSTKRHLIQPCSYQKYGQVLTNRVAHDGDKKLTLSHHHVINPRKDGK